MCIRAQGVLNGVGCSVIGFIIGFGPLHHEQFVTSSLIFEPVQTTNLDGLYVSVHLDSNGSRGPVGLLVVSS